MAFPIPTSSSRRSRAASALTAKRCALSSAASRCLRPRRRACSNSRLPATSARPPSSLARSKTGDRPRFPASWYRKMNGERQNRGLSPALRRTLADFGGVYFVNGLVAFIFAASGPVAIILAVGTRGGLAPSDLSSWIFGAFFVNGLISIAFCWLYRQPLVFFWTIPGAVLVGSALAHLSYAEVIGAFIATGILMLALGLSGWVRRAMEAVPMPIVMGMVAGVFL